MKHIEPYEPSVLEVFIGVVVILAVGFIIIHLAVVGISSSIHYQMPPPVPKPTPAQTFPCTDDKCD